MDIKFILLVIGVFIFTLGYVNQNKYNCNIIPSLNRIQEQDLKKLFYKDSAFLNYNRDLNFLETDLDPLMINNRGSRPLSMIVSSDDYIDYNSSESQADEYTTSGTNQRYGGR